MPSTGMNMSPSCNLLLLKKNNSYLLACFFPVRPPREMASLGINFLQLFRQKTQYYSLPLFNSIPVFFPIQKTLLPLLWFRDNAIIVWLEKKSGSKSIFKGQRY